MSDVIWYSMWTGFFVACLGFAAILEVAVLLRKRRIAAMWAKADFGYLAEAEAEARPRKPGGFIGRRDRGEGLQK